jgi:hypothetical protein
MEKKTNVNIILPYPAVLEHQGKWSNIMEQSPSCYAYSRSAVFTLHFT